MLLFSLKRSELPFLNPAEKTLIKKAIISLNSNNSVGRTAFYQDIKGVFI